MHDSQTAAVTAEEADFETILADTDLGRRINYKLRFDVYCLDSGFEDPTRFSDGEEFDEHDAKASHFLVRCLTTGEWLAGARLIVKRDEPLPVETYCRIRPHLLEPLGAIEGEISRLLIVRRSAGFRVVDAQGVEDALCSRTEVLRRLLIGLFTSARDVGMRNTAFFLTPALKRVVARLGIECLPIGDPCEHRGTRHPHVARVDDALEALFEHGPAIRGMREVGTPYRRFSELTLPVAKTVRLARPVVCGEDPANPACRHPS